MLKEGDIVYITQTEYARIPAGMAGARGIILYKSKGGGSLPWTGPPGQIWAVDIPNFGSNRFHEMELIKLCKKD